MELEEAKKILERSSEIHLQVDEEPNKFDIAIKIVLQELNNSIPKDIIREKINERQFELQQEYKDFKDDIRLNTLQEIYYLNESEK